MVNFRSVLPHEPLPQESFGYLHIQGAFEPRRIEESDDKLFFWNKESLRDAIFRRFKEHEILRLPIQTVVVLDEPPFSKARIVLESSVSAFHALIKLRKLKLSPLEIFEAYASYGCTFGSKSIQVTQITTAPLPEPSWTRSSPPKFRRLIARQGEDISSFHEERQRTRFIFVTNLLENSTPEFWNDSHCVAEAIRSVVNLYDSSGRGAEVFVTSKKMTSYCHIGMRSAQDAQRVIQSLQESRVTWKYTDEHNFTHSIESGQLFLDYASITHRSEAIGAARNNGDEIPKGEPSRSECTSSTAHVVVPGLLLVENFLTVNEEEAIMAVLTGPHAPWAPAQATPTEGGSVKRKVQHYGYVFDYQSADVLRDRTQVGANCPPLPAVPSNANVQAFIQDALSEGRGWDVLAGVISTTRSTEFQLNDGSTCQCTSLNQMTVNRYAPGEGIGSHTDTPTAFKEGLVSISLNSGIVMEFRKVGSFKESRKLVYLPPRSLLLLTGPAFYEWEHMIIHRRTDTHNGVILPRGVRVSLTIRTALDLDGKPLPLLESSIYPPVWGQTPKTEAHELSTPECEKQHVHAVYDAIAMQWHHTRGRRGVLWPGATQFLQHLPSGSIVADVGCGDGKYFPAIWEAGSYVVGTDISLPLLRTATESGKDDVPESRQVSGDRKHLREHPAVVVADCMSVPIRDKSCDAAICIAVLHHLSTRARRIRCIEELARIVKIGGTINIQAWAIEQEKDSRRRFASSDVFVPFNAQPKYLQLSSSEPKDSCNGNPVDGHLADGSFKSTSEIYSEAFNADFDESKGLVVFKRYCHLYRKGELKELVAEVKCVKIMESGFESGNHFVILEVTK